MHRLPTTDEFEDMLRGVSEERRAGVKKFRKPEDAYRGLTGELLIRAVIFDKLQITNEQIVFAANRYGKPFLKGYPFFHFNISHSGNWIVCAVTGEPVGIDIEQMKPIDLEIARHFFSMEEYRCLLEKEGQEQLRRFYDLWTMKESYVKWAGRGLSLPPRFFSVDVEAYRENRLRMADPGIRCFFRRWNVHPDYKMAICSTSGLFPESFILKTYEDLRISL